MGWLRRGFLPRPGDRGLRRSAQNPGDAADRPGAARRAAIGRRRRLAARRAMDRSARRQPAIALHDHHLLRRPGFSGAPQAAGAKAPGTGQCDGLPATRHLAGARSGGVLPRQAADYKLLLFASLDEAAKAYDAGQCDLLSDDIAALHVARSGLAQPGDHTVLPELITKSPVGPIVRQGDDQWFNIVRWTHFAMLDAEELNIGSANADDALQSENSDIRRLLGVRRRLWRGAGTFRRLGLSRHQAGRQLWRGVRAQPRPGLALGDGAPAKRAMVEGRTDVRAAGAVRAVAIPTARGATNPPRRADRTRRIPRRARRKPPIPRGNPDVSRRRPAFSPPWRGERRRKGRRARPPAWRIC